MLRAKQIGCCVALLLGFSTAIATPQGLSGIDEPCTTGFGPWRQRGLSVPNEDRPIGLAEAEACAIALRPLLWEPGQTITVCFRSGTQKARVRVALIASEWLQYANLKFDFGDITDPRICQDGSQEAIKIDFLNTGPKSGHWSAVGKLSLKNNPSMNLALFGEDELPAHPVSRRPLIWETRGMILHEFGHALGLLHEHQNPKSGCNAELDQEAIVAFSAQQGWSPKTAERNLMEHTDPQVVDATEFDRKSIMHPGLPASLFKGGDKSPCFVPRNYELSDGDKALIAKLYPKPIVPKDGAHKEPPSRFKAASLGTVQPRVPLVLDFSSSYSRKEFVLDCPSDSSRAEYWRSFPPEVCQ
jgi:hypothetical protein